MVLYSPDDGTNFYYVLNSESPPRPQIFRGSIDPFTPVRQIFSTPFEAKRVRIKPQTWNNAIALRVEIIGCSEESPTTTPSFEYLTTQLPKVAHCDDEMGLRNGSMVDQQISVSSEASQAVGKTHIRLNSESSWQPLSDSTTEWVQLDFLEPRDITGIVSKGGKKGWVTTYAVKYSHNGKDWNPVVDEHSQNEKTFLGNFDHNSPQVNNLAMPINARYLRVLPIKWHKTIQLRLEIHGCFKPYPVLALPSTTTESSLPCNNCPGVEVKSLEMEACRCLVDQWFDGLKCVNRTQCPCMVGHITYEVGSVFEKEDCSECICKLGGVSHCTPKHCAPCKEGLRSTVTSTCRCTCQPCPENTILCPTSNICINSTLWCNGVQDCPDDEVNCVTTSIPTTTTEKPSVCPIVQCQPGYKKVIEEPAKKQTGKNVFLSPLLNAPGSTKKKAAYAGIKSAFKTKHPAFARPEARQEVVEELICPQISCEIDKPPSNLKKVKDQCPPAICQPNFIAVYRDNTDPKSKSCPKYSCYPKPPPDAVCYVTGRTFNTFDNTEFKYDICNHVIGRDLDQDEWDVALKKNCSRTCSRDLAIRHDQHEIILRADFSIKYDGYEYTIEQIKNIGAQNKGFSITHLGSILLFTSNRYGFWIVWTSEGNVKFGVVHKLANKVDGLCGYFNNNPEDDKRKPDGSQARTTADFGNSWALDKEQPVWCESRACPIHIQNKAWEICNKVKEQPLGQCGKVMDIEAFVSRCLDTTCACMERSEGNHTASEQCRCQAMQTFAIDCLSTDSSIDLSDWRMQQDC
uniref:F5/8 type C domain-containing protein n=1 Tax=Dendroctonus ponderosae TaxID=77166 RepID=A0AAR5PSZ2_DENPD